MKTRIIYIITLFCIAFASFAQTESKKADKNSVVVADIKVYGNCGMCKERIESALDTKGVKKATWDPKTKNLNVVYVPSKITEQQICDIVAKAGHDTDKSKAKDEVYAKLPFCCLYRDHDHSGIQDDNHKKKDHKDHH
jgi:periplasmic mercuric ion binding protein